MLPLLLVGVLATLLLEVDVLSERPTVVVPLVLPILLPVVTLLPFLLKDSPFELI